MNENKQCLFDFFPREKIRGIRKKEGNQARVYNQANLHRDNTAANSPLSPSRVGARELESWSPGVLSSAANHKDWDGKTGIPVCAGSMGSLGPPEGSPLMKSHKHRLLVNKCIPPGNCGH